jgi:alpha,alpha-trehalase
LETTSDSEALPNALEDKDLWARLSGVNVAVFLDFDGTLAPIVDNPSDATLPFDTKKALEELSTLCQVAILSGRDVEDVQSLVGLSNVTYVGCHGFDVIDRTGKILASTKGDEFVEAIKLADIELQKELAQFPGIIIERKRHSVALHYRNANSADISELRRRFQTIASKFPTLRTLSGKMVLELLPSVEWNKGTAFLSLNDSTEFRLKKLFPIFMGDDQTDEDVFHAIRNKGAGIVVGQVRKKTWARYYLKDYIDVGIFLGRLVQKLIHSQTAGNQASGFHVKID